MVGALRPGQRTSDRPCPYAEFASLLARSFMVVTDSGGIQEEAPSLGKPVLVARTSTERIEGVEAGTRVLTGPDPDAIFREGDLLLTDEAAYREISKAPNPYGDGQASRYSFEKLKTPLLVPEELPVGNRGVVEARPTDEVWPDSQEVVIEAGEFDFGLQERASDPRAGAGCAGSAPIARVAFGP